MANGQDGFGWREWLFAAIAVVVCGAVAAILSEDFRAFMKHSAVTSWAAAVGTFAAAGTALWVSLGEARRRDAERERSVDVFRWVLGSDLARVTSAIEVIDNEMAELEQLSLGQSAPIETQEALVRAIGRLQSLSWEAQLPQLVHFHSSIAQPIAEIIGCLPTHIFNVGVFTQPRVLTQQLAELIRIIRSRNSQITLAAKSTGWLD